MSSVQKGDDGKQGRRFCLLGSDGDKIDQAFNRANER